MFPVIFKLGPISLNTFPPILALASFLAFYATWTKAKEDDCEFFEIADIFLLTFIAGILGGRVFEVFSSWSLYSQDFWAIVSFWSYPGFSAWGTVLGGGVGCAFLTRRKKINMLCVFDYLSFGASIALPILFLGHTLSGSYYGRETSFFWGISTATIFGRRHPTAILGFILFFAAFLIIARLGKRVHPAGFLFFIWLSSFSLISFFLEILRGDVFSMERKLVNIAFSIVAFSASITFLYLLSKRSVRADVQLVASSIFKVPGMVFHITAKILPKRRRVPLRLRRRFF